LKFLIDFYPKHIEKEDRNFFMPIMKYFSQEEKEVMLQEEREFDKNLVHQTYQDRIHEAEKLVEND